MNIDIEKIGHPSLYVHDVIQESMERHGQPKQFSVDFCPFLDSQIWGMKRKRLVTIAGRPSQGKSNILGELAYSFSGQGKKGILFSFEMSKEEVIERWLACHCQIDNFDITTGRWTEYYNRVSPDVTAFTEDLKKRNLLIVEGMGKNFEELFAIIEKVGDIDFVVIDYIQLVKNSGKDTEKRIIDDYIQRLRELAIKKNMLAVIGSQINRSTFDGTKISEPQLHNLKGSGSIEEISDMVWLLHWWHFYKKEEPENKYLIDVAKNRGGRTGKFACTIDAKYNRIYEGEIYGYANSGGEVEKRERQGSRDDTGFNEPGGFVERTHKD